jgi:hypothetical protein
MAVKDNTKSFKQQDIIELCAGVFCNDKTVYNDYGKNELDRDGNKNKNPGQRFATPMEIVEDFARKHDFHSETWERIREISRERTA